MSSWRQQQSVVVGGGKPHSGCLYRALVPLSCDWCHGPVAVGEEFTRSSRGRTRVALQGGWLRVVCRSCGRQEPPGRKETADGG